MLAHLRESLALSTQGIPRRWLHYPYEALFNLTKTKLQSPSCDVWLRNSLANDYWEFAQSDLDLTVWVTGGFRDAAAKWPKIKAQRYLLIGGEIHVFPAELVPKYVNYANPLELGRDPILASKISFKRKPTNSEKIAFIIKSLLNDKKLAHQPNLRRRKWHFILSSLELGFERLPPSFNCEYVVANFLKPNVSWLQAFSVEEICLVLGTSKCPVELSNLEKMLKPNQQVWFDQTGSEDAKIIEEAREDFLEYLFSMMCWEVWGIFPLVQLTCGLTLLQLSQHINNQLRLLDALLLSSERKEFLRKGFLELQSDYSSIRDSF